MIFSEMSLDSEIINGLTDMGITTPTEIQETSIPKILDSNDTHILGQAKTGTGKTLAFAIPIIQLINKKKKKVQALVLVPTRELCKQTSEVIRRLAKYKSMKVVEVYGGVSINRQIHEIKTGGQIIVATPGRLIDIYQRGEISFKHIRFVTLDEADRMLDMGFFPDMEYILLTAMKGCHPRLMLYSATMAKEIKKLATTFTKGTDLYEINVSHDDRTVENCEQYYYLIRGSDKKYAYFIEILNSQSPKDIIVFVRTKRWAEKLYKKVNREKMLSKDLHLRADMLHGDLTQAKREVVIDKFKRGDINCLIATNVAARGLDFQKVSHVINYDLPDGGDAIDDYIHRIGRTARMDASNNGKTRDGIAISLITRGQVSQLKQIENFICKDIVKQPLPEIKELTEYSSPRSEGGRNRGRGSDRRPSGRSSSQKRGRDSRSGGRRSNDRRSGDRRSGDRRSSDRRSGNRSSGERNTGERKSGNRSYGNNSSGPRGSNDKRSGDRKSNGRYSGNGNSQNKSSDSDYFNGRRSGNRSSGGKSFNGRSSNDRSSGRRNSNDRRSGDRKSNNRSDRSNSQNNSRSKNGRQNGSERKYKRLPIKHVRNTPTEYSNKKKKTLIIPLKPKSDNKDNH